MDDHVPTFCLYVVVRIEVLKLWDTLKVESCYTPFTFVKAHPHYYAVLSRT